MKAIIYTLIATVSVWAVPTQSDRYDALHRHFSQKTVDPVALWVLIGLVILFIVATTVQHLVHMHHLKKQHEEMIRHHNEMIAHQKELLDHIRRKG